jgi:hypothetical protein
MTSISPRADRSRREARTASWDLDTAEPGAVTLCRTVARQIMADAWGLDRFGDLADDAALIVSELVTNVHRHVRPPRATLTLTWSGEVLSIQVRDASGLRPAPPPRPRAGASGLEGSGWDWTGWGLRLVEAVAAAYGGGAGVRPDPGGRGKIIQVELPARPAFE